MLIQHTTKCTLLVNPTSAISLIHGRSHLKHTLVYDVVVFFRCRWPFGVRHGRHQKETVEKEPEWLLTDESHRTVRYSVVRGSWRHHMVVTNTKHRLVICWRYISLYNERPSLLTGHDYLVLSLYSMLFPECLAPKWSIASWNLQSSRCLYFLRVGIPISLLYYWC